MAKTLLLPPEEVVTFTAVGSGLIERLPDQPGGASQSDNTTLTDGATLVKGPFADQTQWRYDASFTFAITKPAALRASGNTFDAGTNVFDTADVVRHFDDFYMKVLDETNGNWILNAGSDDLAVDPAVVIAENGTVFCDAGDGDGTVAVDGSQIVWAIPVQADSGGLYFEARVKIEDIALCSVNVGLTDVSTLEEPFSIATATLTSVATDAVCFTFDDGATLKEWHMSGVDGDTEATGNGALGSDSAPVNDTFQVLRCEIASDGESADFFVDGIFQGRLTASVCAASTDLFFTCIINGDGSNASAVGLTIDYVDIGHNR